MVQTYGMSPVIGSMHVGKEASPEVRVQVRQQPDTPAAAAQSPADCCTCLQVDAEVSRMLSESYDRVTHLLVGSLAPGACQQAHWQGC